MTVYQMWELIQERHPGTGETQALIHINNVLAEFHKKTRTLWKIVELEADVDSATCTLPTDLLGIRGLFYDVAATPSAQYASAVKGPDKIPRLVTRQEKVATAISTPVYFRSAKTQVKVGTIGSAGTIVGLTDGLVTIDYAYKEAEITSLTAVPEADSAYHEAVVLRVCEGLYIGDENVTNQRYCFSRWKDAIKDAKAEANLEGDDEEWNIRLHEI